MRFDDAQVERYSRQLVLAEIGPRGQARLAAARVAIAAVDAGAERVVAHLAAAGVGTLALPDALRALVDPLQADVALVSLDADPSAPFDAALLDTNARSDAPSGAGGATSCAAAARRAFWIANGRAAELPPCNECTVAALGRATDPSLELMPLRDTVLGTIVATEIVKALLDIGTGLGGHVLTYDPEDAALTTTLVVPRPGCRCLR